MRYFKYKRILNFRGKTQLCIYQSDINFRKFKFYCINISGYKKLNGSQVLKENIAFILNSLKLSILENNKDKTIVTSLILKVYLGTRMKNIPIGLFGNFYNHELTFLIEKIFIIT